MDILSHGLWAGAGAALANRQAKKRMSVRLAAFFGIFPDLFAFTALPIWAFVNFLQKDFTFTDLPRDLPSIFNLEPVAHNPFWMLQITSVLYALSHSAVVFALVFGLVYLMRRRVVWEMAGWLFHIMIDVFTHSYEFYPTPVLWPISGWRFDGLAWHTPWFLAANYLALAVVYLAFIRKWRKKKILAGEPAPVLSALRRDIDVRPAAKRLISRYVRRRIEEA